MIAILYVDDEPALLEITKIYLEKTGEFAVATCLSAEEALKILESCRYDAVISDYQMPGMDGLQFLKRFRQDFPALPFILFTGKGREEVAVEALNSGADFYLQKGGDPISQFAELQNKIFQGVKRRRAEEALQESEIHYRGIVDNAPVGIFRSTPEGRFLEVNPFFARMCQYASPEEMIDAVNRTSIADALYADSSERDAIVAEVRANGGWHTFNIAFRRLDGSTFQAMMTMRAMTVPEDGRQELEGFVVDMTEIRRAEERITSVERRYHNLFNAAGDGMLVLDHGSGKILDANPAASGILGYSVEELRALHHRDLFAGPETPEGPAPENNLLPPPVSYRRKDRTVFPAEITESRYPQKKRTISIVSIRDITERKRAEDRVIAAQRLYAVLSQINQAIVRVRDLPTLLSDTCRIIVEFGKFRMAWIGFVDHETGIIRPVANRGAGEGYLDEIEIATSGDVATEGPVAHAIRGGRHEICNDIGTDPRMAHWRDEALKRGFRSNAAFPIRLHGNVVGAIAIYAGEPGFFNENEVNLLDEIAMDISLALDMLDEQARRTHAEKALAGSEERAKFLAEVLELSSQAFAVGFPDGRFGVMNPAFCELLGYTESELHSLTWTAITPPEYREVEEEALRELDRTGVPRRYEKEYIQKDGSRIPVELFTHRIVDAGGNTLCHYAFVTDISERRKAEDALRAERDRAQQYLDIAGVMLAVIDNAGTVILINRKGSEILGYAEEEILGKSWVETFVPERLRPEVKEVLDRILGGEIAPFEYHENPVLTRSGEERIIAFHNTFLKGPSSELSGILFSGEDITLRKQAEDAVRESEERFRNLIENAFDMIRIISGDGRIAYSSPSTVAITGYSPEEVIGKSPLDFVHPDDRERVRDAMDEVFNRTNTGDPTEYRIRHAGGHYIDVEAVALNLLEVRGINGLVTITRPITLRRNAERALVESEKRYRTVFRLAPDPLILVSDRILDCNPAAERLFGYSRTEMVGQEPGFLQPLVQPDGGRNSADLLREHLQVAESGIPLTFPWVFRKRDGMPIDTDVSLMAAEGGSGTCLVIGIHDLSRLNRELSGIRKISGFTERGPDPVVECSTGREVTYANPAAYTALRARGMPANPLAFLPGDIDPLRAFPADMPPAILYREVAIGSGVYGEAITPAPEGGGIRIHARDITDLVLAGKAYEQANRNLNRLIRITRHDIRNRLAGVIGYLELSLGLASDPELSGYLRQVEASARQILQRVEFTKEYDDFGTRPARWQTVSRVIGECTANLDLGSIVLDDGTGDLAIFADPMFSRVVFNLLENSLRHGGGVSRIAFSVQEGPDHCTLVYEDDGGGIAAEDKEEIFSRNSRTHPGIGLFLSREILIVTGITMSERGEPGKGVRFELVIPKGTCRRGSSA